MDRRPRGERDDEVTDVLRRFEVTAGQLGMALQGSVQQSEAVFNLVSTLQKILGDLLVGVIETRESLKEIRAVLDNGPLRRADGRPPSDGGSALEHRVCQIVVRPLGALGNE